MLSNLLSIIVSQRRASSGTGENFQLHQVLALKLDHLLENQAHFFHRHRPLHAQPHKSFFRKLIQIFVIEVDIPHILGYETPAFAVSLLFFL
jgi:hypothetical protein